MLDELKLNAEWTDDCQGKKDYDGDILSVSTRYWPNRHGGMNVLNEPGQPPFITGSDEPLAPHATSAIRLQHRGDDIEIVSMDFTGDTLEQVKAQVEAWAQEQFERVVKALRSEFSSDTWKVI